VLYRAFLRTLGAEGSAIRVSLTNLDNPRRTRCTTTAMQFHREGCGTKLSLFQLPDRRRRTARSPGLWVFALVADGKIVRVLPVRIILEVRITSKGQVTIPQACSAWLISSTNMISDPILLFDSPLSSERVSAFYQTSKWSSWRRLTAKSYAC
jgi:hypothetical protein